MAFAKQHWCKPALFIDIECQRRVKYWLECTATEYVDKASRSPSAALAVCQDCLRHAERVVEQIEGYLCPGSD